MHMFCFCASVRLGTIIIAFFSMVSKSIVAFQLCCNVEWIFLYSCISQLQALLPMCAFVIVGAVQIREFALYFEQNYEYPKEGQTADIVKYLKSGTVNFIVYDMLKMWRIKINFHLDADVFVGTIVLLSSVYSVTCVLAAVGAYKVPSTKTHLVFFSLPA